MKIKFIGTGFLHRENPAGRHGECQFCGRHEMISEFNANKWFFLFFIPVFPLGKRHVINYCPACRKYMEIKIKHNPARQSENSDQVFSALKQNNDKPQQFIYLHNSLMLSGNTGKAGEVADEMYNRFPESLHANEYLAEWYVSLKMWAKALPFYERMLSINPGHAKARSVTAEMYIRNGNFIRAEELLLENKAPYPGVPMEMILFLALAYRKKEMTHKAYEILCMVANHPGKFAGENTRYRKVTRTLEKELGVKGTVLPKRIFNTKLIKRTAVAFAIVIGTVTVVSVYKYTNQLLYIINPFPEPARVKLSNNTYEIEAQSTKKLKIEEGEYAVKAGCAGFFMEETVLPIVNNPWERLWNQDQFVYNIGSAGLIITSYIQYAEHPESLPPISSELSAGKNFYRFSGVDYMFQAYPEELSLGFSSQVITRKAVELYTAPIARVLRLLANNGVTDEEILTFAESRLSVIPDNQDLLQEYSLHASSAGLEERMFAFFKKLLDRRPVAVDVHRYYQEMTASREGRDDGLKEYYSSAVQKEPGNSSLHYLLGRILHGEDALKCYNKALTLDRGNAYAWHALAYSQLIRGNLAKAVKYSEEACSLAEKNFVFLSFRNQLREAEGDYKTLMEHYKQNFENDPSDYTLLFPMLKVAAVLGGEKLAVSVIEDFFKSNNFDEKNREETRPYLDVSLFYYLEEFDRLYDAVKETMGMEDRWGFIACISLGNLNEAEKILAESTGQRTDYLCLYLAGKEKGETEAASRFLARAMEEYVNGTPADKIIASLFGGDVSGDPYALYTGLSYSPQEGRIITRVLAWLYPGYSGKFKKLSDFYNYDIDFPYYFLKSLRF
ncbi:MAG: zinc-ribbon domain-containing protein [Spirochaetales bacterium]|nr:zinc-ribbon domain-containing protein [Spirochaetales bacterium]